MTEIALVADLHGNVPALEVVDADIRKRSIRHIYCLGDTVGKGPCSADTLDWALQNCEVILRGNWDEGIGLKQYPADEFYYEQLGEKRMKALTEFPMEHHMLMSGKKTRLIHGRPSVDWPLQVYDRREDLEPMFDPDWDIVGYADIHRQGHRVLGTRGILFNTGSVGNAMGVTEAQYTIVRFGDHAGDPLDIVMVSLPYDKERAVRDARLAAEKGLVNADLYIREIETGVYAR